MPNGCGKKLNYWKCMSSQLYCNVRLLESNIRCVAGHWLDLIQRSEDRSAHCKVNLEMIKKSKTFTVELLNTRDLSSLIDTEFSMT